MVECFITKHYFLKKYVLVVYSSLIKSQQTLIFTLRSSLYNTGPEHTIFVFCFCFFIGLIMSLRISTIVFTERVNYGPFLCLPLCSLLPFLCSPPHLCKGAGWTMIYPKSHCLLGILRKINISLSKELTEIICQAIYFRHMHVVNSSIGRCYSYYSFPGIGM